MEADASQQRYANASTPMSRNIINERFVEKLVLLKNRFRTHEKSFNSIPWVQSLLVCIEKNRSLFTLMDKYSQRSAQLLSQHYNKEVPRQ